MKIFSDESVRFKLDELHMEAKLHEAGDLQ